MIFRAIISRYKLHQVLFWLLIFAAWYYLRYQDYTSAAVAFQVTLIKVADLALLVYGVNGWLIPRYLYQGKLVLSIIFFLLAIGISGFLKALLLDLVIGDAGAVSLKVRLYENVISDFFLVTSGAALKLLADYLAMQRRMATMAREKAETELAFLKSQINPHFLFNSLNAVYFLIHKDNREARQALHTFSEMLRYQLYEARGTRIPIEKELGYLRDYVAMQKLRRDEGYEVSFSCGEGLSGFSIEPLLLIPFVENAFKHLHTGLARSTLRGYGSAGKTEAWYLTWRTPAIDSL